MANGNNLFDNDYVDANIFPANLDFYVVSEDKLKNISSSSYWNDLLALLASLSWGAYFSTEIAIKTSEELSAPNLATLGTYQSVFFWFGILVGLLFLYLKWNHHSEISSITESDIKLSENDDD